MMRKALAVVAAATAAATLAVNGLASADPVATTGAKPPPGAWIERRVPVPLVGTAMAYVPNASVPRVVLFISGDGGWNAGVVEMARRIAPHAVVIGISYPSLRRSGESSTRCWYPAGDLEAISHAAEKRLGLPQYMPPVLVGYSSGATLVYAALAAAPHATFSGGLSLGFCPDLPTDRPVCQAGAWHPRSEPAKHVSWLPSAPLPQSWFVLHGTADQVCALDETRRFVATIPTARLDVIEGAGHGYSRPAQWGHAFDKALDALWTQPAPAPASRPRPVGSEQLERSLDDLHLPLEYRWAVNPRASLVFWSGDGGWASLDEGVADTLVDAHVNVIGVSSLRYFWHQQTPDRVADDLWQIVSRVERAGEPVLVGGYSFGAAVVPLALRRWAPAERQRVAGLALITPGASASFEIDPLDWVRSPADDPDAQVAPAVKATGIRTLCIVGTEEEPAECPASDAGSPLQVVRLEGSHHFHGDYTAVGRAIATFVDGVAAAR
jgi:type IV secretory pathway VirJ component